MADLLDQVHASYSTGAPKGDLLDQVHASYAQTQAPAPPAQKTISIPMSNYPLDPKTGQRSDKPQVMTPQGLDKPLSTGESLAMAVPGFFAGGAEQTGQGLHQMTHPENLDDFLSGTSNALRGVGTLASPFVAPTVLAHPIRTALGVAAGTAGQQGTQAVMKALGAPEGASNLTGDAVGILTGGVASHIPEIATGAARAGVKALSKAATSDGFIGKAIDTVSSEPLLRKGIGMLSPRAKNVLEFAADIRAAGAAARPAAEVPTAPAAAAPGAPAVPVEDTELLDALSRQLAGKAFAKASPAEQVSIRDLAGRMDKPLPAEPGVPTTAARAPTTPAAPTFQPRALLGTGDIITPPPVTPPDASFVRSVPAEYPAVDPKMDLTDLMQRSINNVKANGPPSLAHLSPANEALSARLQDAVTSSAEKFRDAGGAKQAESFAKAFHDSGVTLKQVQTMKPDSPYWGAIAKSLGMDKAPSLKTIAQTQFALEKMEAGAK